jgi:hypothetical protein
MIFVCGDLRDLWVYATGLTAVPGWYSGLYILLLEQGCRMTEGELPVPLTERGLGPLIHHLAFQQVLMFERVEQLGYYELLLIVPNLLAAVKSLARLPTASYSTRPPPVLAVQV